MVLDHSISLIHKDSLGDSLNVVDLSHNKLGNYVNTGIFTNKSFYVLSLENNSIEILEKDAFAGMTLLDALSIASNPISELPPYVLEDLSDLDYLLASDCELTHISTHLFESSPSLKILDLSKNKLHTFNVNTVKKLKEMSKLFIDGNPFECDCQLYPLWHWSKENDISLINDDSGEGPTCKEREWEEFENITCSRRDTADPLDKTATFIGTATNVAQMIALFSLFAIVT